MFTGNLVKLRHAVFEICEWTDMQTDRHWPAAAAVAKA